MAYETPITIKKTIENISNRKYLLPSIQREFVWEPEQIEQLFDSLMRNYPISTFLFWNVKKGKIKDFQFYEFLRNFHEKNFRHNTKVDLNGDEDVISILDGQQRMTSLYIALKGSYAKKERYYKWDSPNAFPKKKLYLNILKKSEEIENEYLFKFLKDEEVVNDKSNHWFECSKILDFTEITKVTEFLMTEGLLDSSKYSVESTQFALRSLNEFWNVIHQKGVISYFLEEDQELDKVLQIFIRINSGGTKLSYSDLLLSIATAQWEEKDAREVIHEFVDDINSIGSGFNFNKDIVLKSCLVLSDFSDIRFKVDNFTKSNMRVIEQNWEHISKAFRSSVELVSKLGFSRENLSANNALIPISYFIYKNNFENSILHNQSREDDRKAIKEWLARVLLKGTFGGTPDSLYPVMRNLINNHIGRFPLQEIINEYKGKRKSISFSEDDIDSILDLNYGSSKAFCALSLLYPSMNNSFSFHQDHIHPKSFFSKKKLSHFGVNNEDDRSDFISRFNKLPNLQLLQSTQNIEKTNKLFDKWLSEIYPNESDKNVFLLQNYINQNESLEFSDFIVFFENRKMKLKDELMQLLKVNKGE